MLTELKCLMYCIIAQQNSLFFLHLVPLLKSRIWLSKPSTIHLQPLIWVWVHGASSLSREAKTPLYLDSLQLIQRDAEMLPRQLRDIISPTSPGSAPGPPPGRKCLKHLACILIRCFLLNWLLSSVEE